MADYKEAKSICNLNPSAYVPAGHPIAASHRVASHLTAPRTASDRVDDFAELG